MLLCIAGIASFVSADWENNIPVPGKRPQFTIGQLKNGIDFEIVYDLMCSDSAELNPAFQAFLNSTWNVTNTKVIDEIKVSYSFMPLPYHHEAWVPHLLVPYFLDNCDFGPNPCQLVDYMTYCFNNQDWILEAKSMSENQIIQGWTGNVSQALKLNQTELLNVYSAKTDGARQSEWRTRLMYKYNTFHHNSGTPFGYVNGILMENFPSTVAEWFDVLNTVYNS